MAAGGGRKKGREGGREGGRKEGRAAREAGGVAKGRAEPGRAGRCSHLPQRRGLRLPAPLRRRPARPSSEGLRQGGAERGRPGLWRGTREGGAFFPTITQVLELRGGFPMPSAHRSLLCCLLAGEQLRSRAACCLPSPASVNMVNRFLALPHE